MTSDARFPVAIGVGALATTWLFTMEAGPPLQGPVAITFLLVGPGLAWVRVLRLGDRAAEWTLAVVASLGIDVAVATTLLTTGLWTPARALGTVVMVTIAGSMVEVCTAQRWQSVDDSRCVDDLAADPGAPRRQHTAAPHPLEFKYIAWTVLLGVVLLVVLLIM